MYVYVFVFMNTELIRTVNIHILCKHSLLFWMLLIVIYHLTALILKNTKCCKKFIFSFCYSVVIF